MNHLISHHNHKGAVKSLYKELLKRSRRLKFEVVNVNDTRTKQEMELFHVNPEKYHKYIADEILYNIRYEFKQNHKTVDQFSKCFNRGIESLEVLESNDLNKLIHLVLDFRHLDSQKNAIIGKRFIDNGITEFDGKLREDVTKKFAFPIKSFDKLNNSEKLKRIKTELKSTKDNKFKVLRNYIKYLQMKNKLAVPQSLPYSGMELPKVELSSKIFQSTSRNSLSKYNDSIVIGIILPELEYIINKEYFLARLQAGIKKGPYQPKIRSTSAGTVSIPYIQLPYPELAKRKEIAMDVKSSVRELTLKQMWESDNSGSIKQQTNKDGSIDVSWYKGYGDCRMFPRKHYEYWHETEALWEYSLFYETLKSTKTQSEMETEEMMKYLQKTKSDLISSWKRDIIVTDTVLNENVQKYYKKYNNQYLKQLIKEQNDLVKSLEKDYQVRIDKYTKLVNELNANKVSRHSNLIDDNIVTRSMVEFSLIENDHKIKYKRTGMAYERIGRRKQLADYMDDERIPSFRIGKKFDKNFNFLKL